MPGIDIVDLTDPRSKEKNSRSLRLIKNEDDRIIDHSHLYWLLWSAKEAVFKCRREAVNFSPTTIPVWISADIGGTLSFKSTELEGLFQIEKDYVLAVCSENLEYIDYQVLKSDQNVNSINLREEIIEFFRKENSAFEIGSDELNLPILLPSNSLISISHHNHLGAFAYSKSMLNP